MARRVTGKVRTLWRARLKVLAAVAGVCSLTPVGSRLPPAAAGAANAASAPRTVAYVVNSADGTIVPVDFVHRVVGNPITVGGGPYAIAITPDGSTAWVTLATTNQVVPVDLRAGRVGTPIGTDAGPGVIAITPRGDEALVANVNANSVTPIDLATRTARPSIALDGPATGLAIAPDGKTAYAVNLGPGQTSEVTPISIATGIAGTPLLAPSSSYSIAITPDGRTAWVATLGDNSVTPLDLRTSTFGNPVAAGVQPWVVAISPDGRTLWAMNEDSSNFGGEVIPVDIAANPPAARAPIAIANTPWAGAVSPDGRFVGAISCNGGPSALTPILARTGTAQAALVPGRGSTGVAFLPDQAPVASYTASTAPATQASTFDASSSAGTTAPIARYAWDFGDGTRVSTIQPTVSHTFAQPGAYTVTLTVTDTAGTSTAVVFTGQTVSRNGGPSARARQTINIS